MTVKEAHDNVENMPTGSLIKWINFFKDVHFKGESESIVELVNKMESELEQRGEQEANLERTA